MKLSKLFIIVAMLLLITTPSLYATTITKANEDEETKENLLMILLLAVIIGLGFLAIWLAKGNVGLASAFFFVEFVLLMIVLAEYIKKYALGT